MPRIDLADLQLTLRADTGQYRRDMEGAADQVDAVSASMDDFLASVTAVDRALRGQGPGTRLAEQYRNVGDVIDNASAQAGALESVLTRLSTIPFPALDVFQDEDGEAVLLLTTGAQRLGQALATVGDAQRIILANRVDEVFRDMLLNAQNLGGNLVEVNTALINITRTPLGELRDQTSQQLREVDALEAAVNRLSLAGETLFPDATGRGTRLFQVLQENLALLSGEALVFQNTLNRILTATPPGDDLFSQELNRVRQVEELTRTVEERLRELRAPPIVDPEPVENAFNFLTRIDGVLLGLAEPTRGIADSIREAAQNSQQLSAALNFSPEGIVRLGEQLREAARDSARLTSQFERLRDGLLTVEGLEFERAGGSLERLTTAFGPSRLEITPLAEETDNLSDSFQQLGQVGDAAGAAIGRALSDALIRARDLDDVFRALLATIVQAAATAFVGDPISRLFSGLVGRQFGGRVAAGQSVVVGEAGAEVFTPDTAGTVTPNLGFGGLVVNVQGVNAPELVEAAVNRALLTSVPGVVQSSADTNRFRRSL